MKCIRCAHDSKYKDRPDRRCPSCKGEFAFEPQQGDKFTDMGFRNAIETVSGTGTVKFLPDHVYYQLNRRPGNGVLLGLAILFGSVGGAFGGVLFGFPGFVLAALLSTGMGALAGWLYQRSAGAVVSLPRSTFDTAWRRWLEVHGKPAGLVDASRRLTSTRSPELETEIRSYSFDRAVICDKPELVDVLVANRFHFENNCALLSIDGYPKPAFDTVRAMLANNPKLLVLAVHDATPDGCRLAHRLANDPKWFAGGTARVVDIGLRPAHAKYFPGKILPVGGIRVVADAAITATEAEWLSHHALETAAIRPEQLVKRLYRAMTAAESGALVHTDGGGGVFFLGDSTGTVDGGADSFG